MNIKKEIKLIKIGKCELTDRKCILNYWDKPKNQKQIKGEK